MANNFSLHFRYILIITLFVLGLYDYAGRVIMKYKDFFIERIVSLLKDCNADFVEAVYHTILNMQERSRKNGFENANHRDD